MSAPSEYYTNVWDGWHASFCHYEDCTVRLMAGEKYCIAHREMDTQLTMEMTLVDEDEKPVVTDIGGVKYGTKAWNGLFVPIEVFAPYSSGGPPIETEPKPLELGTPAKPVYVSALTPLKNSKYPILRVGNSKLARELTKKNYGSKYRGKGLGRA